MGGGEEVLVFGPCDQLEGVECFLFAVEDVASNRKKTSSIEANATDEGKHQFCGVDVVLKKKKRLLLRQLRWHLLRFIRQRSRSFAEQNNGQDNVLKSDHDSVTTADTASVTVESSNTTWSAAEDGGSQQQIENDYVPLIQQRLLNHDGIETSHFAFVPDRVSKEVIGLLEDEDEQYSDDNNNVTHVKTGVWQVTKLNDDDGTPQTPFYVVTGVTMDDMVDTKKLRKALFGESKHKRRPKLCMAETSIAEKLVGFQSGTMAPICHSTPMKLYLEESIVENAGVVDDYRDLAYAKNPHRLNVGSGMFGKCLSIDLGKFLEVAKSNEFGMELVSIKKKKMIVSKQSKR